MMAEKKTIVVLGATGKQGGSVVRALLKEGKFHIRGVTRDSSKDPALKLREQGVEIVEADVFHPDTLVHAFNGAYAVFAVTDFWDPSSMNKEVELGKNIIDAAKKANVQHFIWSSLPNVEKITNGKLKLRPFTDKALVDEYLQKSGLNFTIVVLAFYYQNFETWFKPKLNKDNTVVFSLPLPEDHILTSVDVDDLGEAVVNILKNPKQWLGKWVPLFGEHSHASEYAKTFESVSGKKAIYHEITPAEAEKLNMSKDLLEMFDYFRDYGYYGDKVSEMPTAKKLNPHLKTFKQWLEVSNFHKEKF